ncbi:MAG TPA: acyl-CoA dehydrogenase [Algoriphagus sp.]|uniref:acyl-CoA dehydrogenase family protein n=2 Tax=Algoriphagus TaxID=246875 RepID=UPI000C4B981C|nr:MULTISPECIES: acyl-CoA dehydrogenase family protein [unclassified Algoriphagus]MAL14750.1 acyl-CoA dehydrogenase [Algoriphagus sp.]HAD52719.1 acyl-CoA dehydrogenase [Algoriphagus sp.]HAZ23759.1 acyl-CoA dehydrogenase [Algoriphagus sp.]HCD87174.1 acyl-CoA dehydrogenase [Algoriphagus sp.]HCH44752.1 acyl-CoA dehydrogenase [Algoriphagus sp.]
MFGLPRMLFTEEHELFRQSVKDFIAREISPYNAEWEKQKMVSRESWKKFGENGFLGIQAPESLGGMNIQDFRYNAILIEELGLSGCSGPAIGYPLHSDIVMPYILHYGTEEAKRKYIPKMVSGDFIGAVAMTEPGAGSDLQGMRTSAEDKGDHFLVNGSKTFITNGYLSDVVVVAVKTDPAKGAKGISLVLIDKDMKGFSKGKPFEKVGLHAQDTCELFFEDVKVPKENLLGKLGEGFKYLMTELAQERLVVALAAVALGEYMLASTVEYVKQRKAFNKSISEFQNTRFKLAEMTAALEQGRIYCDHLVQLHNSKLVDPAMASAAKYNMTELQCKVADECVQLHGGYGYMWEYGVARAYADARVQRIYAGTNEIMKELIARKILK